jgi:hypothetical protein
LRWYLLVLLLTASIIIVMAHDSAGGETEVDLEYVVYNVMLIGPEVEVRVHQSHLDDEVEVSQYLSPHLGDIDRIRSNWTSVRNTTVTISFWVRTRDPDEAMTWSPYPNATVNFMFCEGQDEQYPRAPYQYSYNGEDCAVGGVTDESGYGSVEVRLPAHLQDYQMFPTVDDPDSGATRLFLPGSDWNFTLRPPQTIQFDSMSTVTWPTQVGQDTDNITVIGYVRYVHTNEGMEGAEVQVELFVELPSNPPKVVNTTTDAEGRFKVIIPGPFPYVYSHTIVLNATDPKTGENATFTLQYRVPLDGIPDDEDDGGDVWFWVILYLVVLTGSVAVVSLGITLYHQWRLSPDDD